MRKKQGKAKSLIEYKSDLVSLQLKLKALGSSPRLRRDIALAKSMVRTSEFRLGICRVVMVGVAFVVTVTCSGCFEETGKAVGHALKAVSNVTHSLVNDVADGLIDLNDGD